MLRGTAGGGFAAPTTVGQPPVRSRSRWASSTATAIPTSPSPNTFSGKVLVLLGSAGATFTAPATVASGSDPNSVAVGDFNGDGDPDLAVADQSPGEIMVLLGSTGGTFTGPAILTTDSGVSAVAVADFNRDGNPDLAVSNVNRNRVRCCSATRGAPSPSRPTSPSVAHRPRWWRLTSTATASLTWRRRNVVVDNVVVLLNSTVTNQAPVAAGMPCARRRTLLTVAAPGVLGNDPT